MLTAALVIPKSWLFAPLIGDLPPSQRITELLFQLLPVPFAAVGVAVWAQGRGWGLLHAAPGWLAWPVALLLLDLAIYAQHIVFHYVPPLWRLHRRPRQRGH